MNDFSEELKQEISSLFTETVQALVNVRKTHLQEKFNHFVNENVPDGFDNFKDLAETVAKKQSDVDSDISKLVRAKRKKKSGGVEIVPSVRKVEKDKDEAKKTIDEQKIYSFKL